MKRYESKMEKYVPLHIGRRTLKKFWAFQQEGGGNLKRTRTQFLRWPPALAYECFDAIKAGGI